MKVALTKIALILTSIGVFNHSEPIQVLFRYLAFEVMTAYKTDLDVSF